MSKIKITFPDGNIKEFDKGVTGYEIAEGISPRLAKDTLAVKLNGSTIDLKKPITDDSEIKFPYSSRLNCSTASELHFPAFSGFILYLVLNESA